jgi:glycosyltransferase involved in cell wall biosynthesis
VSVDVIIPIHNGARFLKRSVGSVLAQGVDGITVWCVDDASTDATPAVLAELATTDPRVRVTRNESNLGVSATRNRAVRLGIAPVVAFLDQDDEWTDAKLVRQLAVLDARPEVDYVVGLQRFIVEPGESAPSWCRPEWLLAPQAGYIPGCLAVRRKSFLRIGFFDESMRTGGDDTDWFARARRLAAPHVALDEVLLNRYMHDVNLSHQEATGDELLTVVRRHLRGGDSDR